MAAVESSQGVGREELFSWLGRKVGVSVWAMLIGWFEGLAQERLWKQQRLDKRLYGQPFPNTQAVLLNLLSPSLKAT